MRNKEMKAALEASEVTLRLQRISNRFRFGFSPFKLFHIRVRNFLLLVCPLRLRSTPIVIVTSDQAATESQVDH